MRKITRTLALLIFSISSMSALSATYNGYTSNESTNSVTGGGLEWKQWDTTIGMSVNQAIAQFSGDGWRMATQTEMAALFNTFNFGAEDSVVFDDLSTTYQSADMINTRDDEASTHNNFLTLFGVTEFIDYGVASDPYTLTRAFFGGGGGCCSYATVLDDYRTTSNFRNARASLSSDRYSGFDSNAATGVALVRTSVVPVPAAAWLFGSALIGLVGVKRKK